MLLRSLSFKFLLLLLGVAAVALSGTVVLRELMLKDFGEYIEGESEDRAYWILADLEGAYERRSEWQEDELVQDTLRALTLGFEMRLWDQEGKKIIDTPTAIRKASPLLKRRLNALSQYQEASVDSPFSPYALFLGGKQIGTVELRPLRPARELVFVGRADSFLLLSILVVGGVAVLLSVLFSRRLTRPIKGLAQAASAISRGDLKRRVSPSRRDEVGDLAEAFNRMASDLETQESLRRKLIADVAHELRTPLGVMRGELEAMMDGLIPNDEDRLNSLYEETGRLKRMVEGIEELNRAEASALSLNRQKFDIRPFLGNMVERFRAQFQDRGVTLDLVCEGTLPDIYADPERVSQIVLNLLSNALKATDQGSRVAVSASSARGEMKIAVEDNGKGISEHDLPHIFERFYRGTGGGLGIGLTIVKELVEAHGGRIEVASVPGNGSVFTVFLPLTGVHNSS
jgi:two-component system sensor histidine kinase BaeS